VVERAKKAMVAAGVTPRVKPIRGGTDGAQLSYMGLPCPNIFAGGVNFHSLQESVSLHAMESAVRVILELARCRPSRSAGG
jgi:tripeptide aminopeptidase